ncbi:uncharacterized protein LOC119936097 [Tachyglossus aculeatus]|uniref:uncharacterized protein LOC119936097 n=1 Tax=Tachyglossus aculeatus TaxID=9261 RepID=UPI0018F60371|nr:uncharacterized protein LOC119936097 [Tachyglossus aculeatus]
MFPLHLCPEAGLEPGARTTRPVSLGAPGVTRWKPAALPPGNWSPQARPALLSRHGWNYNSQRAVRPRPPLRLLVVGDAGKWSPPPARQAALGLRKKLTRSGRGRRGGRAGPPRRPERPDAVTIETRKPEAGGRARSGLGISIRLDKAFSTKISEDTLAPYCFREEGNPKFLRGTSFQESSNLFAADLPPYCFGRKKIPSSYGGPASRSHQIGGGRSWDRLSGPKILSLQTCSLTASGRKEIPSSYGGPASRSHRIGGERSWDRLSGPKLSSLQTCSLTASGRKKIPVLLLGGRKSRVPTEDRLPGVIKLAEKGVGTVFRALKSRHCRLAPLLLLGGRKSQYCFWEEENPSTASGRKKIPSSYGGPASRSHQVGGERSWDRLSGPKISSLQTCSLTASGRKKIPSSYGGPASRSHRIGGERSWDRLSGPKISLLQTCPRTASGRKEIPSSYGGPASRSHRVGGERSWDCQALRSCHCRLAPLLLLGGRKSQVPTEDQLPGVIELAEKGVGTVFRAVRSLHCRLAPLLLLGGRKSQVPTEDQLPGVIELAEKGVGNVFRPSSLGCPVAGDRSAWHPEGLDAGRHLILKP